MYNPGRDADVIDLDSFLRRKQQRLSDEACLTALIDHLVATDPDPDARRRYEDAYRSGRADWRDHYRQVFG